MLKGYKISFDPWALGLFLLVMLPNFIWFAVPAPHDILRGRPSTGILAVAGSLCQVWMVAALCMVKRRESGRLGRLLPALAGICVLVYYAAWLAYYQGAANAFVIGGLALPPCLAFLFYALSRGNIPALVPACLFTVCHVISAAYSFLF